SRNRLWRRAAGNMALWRRTGFCGDGVGGVMALAQRSTRIVTRRAASRGHAPALLERSRKNPPEDHHERRNANVIARRRLQPQMRRTLAEMCYPVRHNAPPVRPLF